MASPGRPRSFDKEKALDAALQVFWRKGYEGASMADLTSAMGIEKPSLYAAFGDKEQLFLQVLDHYQAHSPGMPLRAGSPGLQRRIRLHPHGTDFAARRRRSGPAQTAPECKKRRRPLKECRSCGTGPLHHGRAARNVRAIECRRQPQRVARYRRNSPSRTATRIVALIVFA